MLRKDSVRLTRRFDRIERGLQVRETELHRPERRRAEAASAFGAVLSHPQSASILFPLNPTHAEPPAAALAPAVSVPAAPVPAVPVPAVPPATPPG